MVFGERVLVNSQWSLVIGEGMGSGGFEDLRVFQMAERLADVVWDIVAKWDYFSKDTVGRQFVRAADSVGANISEGVGRWNFQDNRRFVRIARGILK